MSIRDIIHYDPASGEFRWITKPSYKIREGSIAGTVRADGYRIIMIEGVRYYAHRLAWYLYYGDWPSKWIDHIDRNPSNNRIANLREVTYSENAQNSRPRTNSSRPAKGISLYRGKFQVSIGVDKRQYHIGTFSTFEEAVEAYEESKSKLHTV